MARVFFGFPYEFDRDFGDDYRGILRRACSDLGAEYVFGDKEFTADSLVSKMNSCIDSCEYAFFDITGFNPSVMMELGIAFHSKGRLFFMYDEAKHRNSAIVKATKDQIPTNIRGQDHFTYRTLYDLDFGVRSSLRNALGIGKSSLQDLKLKINGILRKKPQRIGEIAETLGNVEKDSVAQALFVLRAEKKVECNGIGMGARWSLTRGN